MKLIIFLSLLLTTSTFPQISGNISPNDFYEYERENWKEKIQYELNVKADTTFDVKFYEINLDIQLSSHYIIGLVNCNIISQTDGLSSIILQLSNAFEITNIGGNAIQHNFAYDSLYLLLDRPYNFGEEISVTIGYEGIPLVLNNTKGMRFVTHGNNEPIIATLSTPYLAHLWFPCKDGPGDKADSVYINITIPDTVINSNQLIAVSNGILDEIESNNNKLTFKWKERYPIIPYYIMVAISNYSHFQQIVTDNFFSSFPIDYYVFKEDSIEAVNGTADLPDAMDLFVNKFGSYPFENEKYAMTQLGFYGAIENQTNTIQNNLSYSWLIISVHELSHMWFGDMITCIDWHHGWLNEGFATYCEALYKEHLGGFSDYKSYMNGLKYLQGGTVYLQDISDPFHIFIPVIYDKGAWVLHMLRGVLGDEIFFDAIKQYATDPRFIYNHASTEDFKEVCETISGINLDFFFEEWIYDEYFPTYTYMYSQDSFTNNLALQINQTQGQLGRREIFEMPINVKINFSDGSDSLLTLWNDQVNTEYNIVLNKIVASLQIDPDEWILRTVTLITDIEEIHAPQYSYTLEANYPNPFNSSTTFQFTIPERTFVTLKLYDILGNEVVTLMNEEKNTGKHKIIFDASELTSGVYFYKLTSNTFSQVRKMLILK